LRVQLFFFFLFKIFVVGFDGGAKVSTVLFARGAIIKPWVFTEVKERKMWDISSSERFDILRNFTNYGLEHWGSDWEGVEKTRNFLLQTLSFMHRYVPYGVLERYPVEMWHRPVPFVGRDDLETLMASPFSESWIELSEMLLGPVPNGFRFEPKHTSNSYSQSISAGIIAAPLPKDDGADEW
jgi:tRNA-dihydrouridine synthase 3